jgi:transposase
MIILYVRSKKSLINFLKEFIETKWISWLGLKEIPGKSTLNDWMKLFNLSFIRNFLNNLLDEEKPKVMAIDATGIDSWQRSRHYERRIKQCGFREDYMPYAKADILIDTKTLLIHDWVLRIKPRHDVLGAKTIFNRLKHKNTLILADKGYDSEPLHKLVRKTGNILYAPVRNKKKIPGGSNRKRCAKGNNKYPQRNTVESAIHALKSMKQELKSKLHHIKKREFDWTIILFNMKRLTNQIQTLLKIFKTNLFRI